MHNFMPGATWDREMWAVAARLIAADTQGISVDVDGALISKSLSHDLLYLREGAIGGFGILRTWILLRGTKITIFHPTMQAPEQYPWPLHEVGPAHATVLTEVTNAARHCEVTF